MKASPLLSICIPTLNRALLLEVLLENLYKEIEPFIADIEVVVADNASTDHTTEIVNNAKFPIRYGRQDKTVGFAKNLIYTVCELARGEFVWVIGDDDMLLPDSIKNVMLSLNLQRDVDYHYLNFGWIDVDFRTKVIREMRGIPPKDLLKKIQCDDLSIKRLDRLEDLATLSQLNSSVLFSGIFCFITRKSFYLQGATQLDASDSLDGASVLLADCFPHVLLTLPHIIGRPIAYIGQPVVLQGINGWEWGEYAHKNMIFGIYQLFVWLEDTTAFDKDAMKVLWRHYCKMAGRLWAHMLQEGSHHKGHDIVLDQAIAKASKQMVFWDEFMLEHKFTIELNLETKVLAEKVDMLIGANPNVRVGVWGGSARGNILFQMSSLLRKHLIWVADRNVVLHGNSFAGSNITISATDTLAEQDIDVLVIAFKGRTNEIEKNARELFGQQLKIISYS